jgi:hypothetical protein
VESIFLGKDRAYNRRFLQMCGHYLVEPTACTPASGWEKGQVENQVGLVRERFFTPRLRVKSLDELNSWLLDKCVGYAKVHKHPEIADRTVWQIFEDERSALIPVPGRFDGFHATTASVSKTCLVRFDSNKYSVSSRAVGRPVEVQAYADRSSSVRMVIVADTRAALAATKPSTIPGTTCPCWRAFPGLCATRALQGLAATGSLERSGASSRGLDDGDRQMVVILSVLMDGLVLPAACAEAIDQNVHSADVILNILARKRDPAPTITILTPAALQLQHAPVADCARYDSLRRAN